jgi:hypothetical protein
MKATFFTGLALVSLLAAATGCSAADTAADDGNDDIEATEDAVKTSPKERLAIQHFLADQDIASAIGNRRHPTPEAFLLQGASFGKPIDTYLVATFVQTTPPGVMDARITRTVAGFVSFGTNTLPSVAQIVFEEASNAETTQLSGRGTAADAIRAYRDASNVQKELRGKKVFAGPKALLVKDDMSFGRSFRTYLVLSAFDATPPGALDAKITRSVAALVRFKPSGNATIMVVEPSAH